MTKKQAQKEFESLLGLARNWSRFTRDKLSIVEAWLIFTDQLCKAGAITHRQYDTWTNPYEYRK